MGLPMRRLRAAALDLEDVEMASARPDRDHNSTGHAARAADGAFPEHLVGRPAAHILDLRSTRLGWGALTILGELQRDPAWNQQRLPRRASIGAVPASYTQRKRSFEPYVIPPMANPNFLVR